MKPGPSSVVSWWPINGCRMQLIYTSGTFYPIFETTETHHLVKTAVSMHSFRTIDHAGITVVGEATIYHGKDDLDVAGKFAEFVACVSQSN